MITEQKIGSSGLIKLLLLCLIAFIGLGFIAVRVNPLKAIGSFLIQEDRLTKADVIVVLSGDLWSRAREAVDLYKQGFARRVLLMRGLKPKGIEELWRIGIIYPEPYVVNKQVLLKGGVPEKAIRLSSKEVNSSYQEAAYINAYIKKNGWNSAIVVTSKFHSRRACITLKAVSKGKIKVICHPSKYDPNSPAVWWTERRQASELFFEYQKLFLYSFYLLFQRINPF
jgi:uncharacterized SAM-binding protein YcdF (DUF218 family)